MKRIFPTKFSECFIEWMEKTLEEVNLMQGVEEIVGVLGENITTIYSAINREFN